jgi:hypothetical protein
MLSHAALRFRKTVSLELLRLLHRRRAERTRGRSLFLRVAPGAANGVDTSATLPLSGLCRSGVSLFFGESVIKGLFMLGDELGGRAVNIIELFAAHADN